MTVKKFRIPGLNLLTKDFLTKLAGVLHKSAALFRPRGEDVFGDRPMAETRWPEYEGTSSTFSTTEGLPRQFCGRRGCASPSAAEEVLKFPSGSRPFVSSHRVGPDPWPPRFSLGCPASPGNSWKAKVYSLACQAAGSEECLHTYWTHGLSTWRAVAQSFSRSL